MPEQRRLVTILFADVTGSTALGESLDPEDVRALMGRYFAHARRVMADHGGTLEKFIGDAVMAVFGLTHAWGDDPERALAAALTLRAAIAEDDVLARWLTLRMGVNTGEVVATDDMSRGDFLITGDAVNITARLEQHAAPGEILVSARTLTAARTGFAFGPARDIEAKGKSQPLRVYPLLARQARSVAVRPPLVGRRQDLLQLDVLKVRALEERQPQILTILAPAGTGKTRLVEEFLDQLPPSDGFQVARLHCQPYGQTITFAPLRELAHQLLGKTRLDECVTRAFLHSGYTAAESAALTHQVVQLLGGEHASSHEGAYEGVTDRESSFNAWRLLVEAVARDQPHILVIEDLHWASDSLLDLIEQVMRPRAPVPLLIIALSRPELLDRRASWGGGQRNTTVMTLQPLNDAQTRDLVDRLTEGMSEDLRAQIAVRSAGNPFFAVELAWALTERQARGDTTALETLPDTVHATVQARLDLLAPEERRVTQAASVVGEKFAARLLYAALPEQTPAEIVRALESLAEHDLLLPAADPGYYAFRHALFREVAYGTLARAERVRMHAALAAALDVQPGQDAAVSGLVRSAATTTHTLEFTAYHYRQAITLAHQSAVPLDVPIDVSRAVAVLEQAGVRSGRAGAFTEARDFLGAAITIAPAARYSGLYEQLGDNGGWGDHAMNAYQQALNHWRSSATPEADDALTGARLIRKLLIIAYRSNVASRPTPEEVVVLREEAEHLLAEAYDENEHWHLRIADLFMTHDIDEHMPLPVTMADGMEAVSYFEAVGDWQAFSEALDGCALLALRSGSFTDVLMVSQRRLTAPDLPASERGDATSMVVRSYIALCQLEKSIQTVRDALAQVGPGSSFDYLFEMLSGAAIAFWLSGKWAELDQIRVRLEAAYGPMDARPRAQLSASIGTLQIALCRDDDARVEESLAIFEQLLDPERNPNDFMLIQLYRTGDPSRITLSQQGIQRLTFSLWLVLLFLCEHGLSVPAELLAQARAEDANEQMSAWRCVTDMGIALEAGDMRLLASAIDAAEARGLIPFAAHMRIVLAQRTGDAAPLSMARPVLQDLGDALFLRKLEDVAARL
jgi:class 3 adenylate cyclase